MTSCCFKNKNQHKNKTIRYNTDWKGAIKQHKRQAKGKNWKKYTQNAAAYESEALKACTLFNI